MLRRLLQRAAARFLRPTAVTIAGVNPGQTPCIIIDYGRLWRTTLDLDCSAHTRRIIARTLGGADLSLSEDVN